MLLFKEVGIEDKEQLKKFLFTNDELSCECNFVNMLVWGSIYKNMYAISDNQLIIKSGIGENEVFRLPFGNDFEKGMALIKEYCGTRKPSFWVQEGGRYERFISRFSNEYSFEEKRDASDYIYSRQLLADLAGKKYHSKRNHISYFSRNFDWHFEAIDGSNIDKVRECAEEWYFQNRDRMDKFMRTEKKGVYLMFENMEYLNISGGAIFVGDKVVAFTLGSAINEKIFDIHIEKALSQYQTAYTVINNQFVKNALSDYEFVNREDDLGIEGLRKAKLSYNPQLLLKKYSCIPR